MRSPADIGRCMHHVGDHDLGASVAAQMDEVCGHLPEPVFRRPLAETASLKANDSN